MYAKTFGIDITIETKGSNCTVEHKKKAKSKFCESVDKLKKMLRKNKVKTLSLLADKTHKFRKKICLSCSLE